VAIETNVDSHCQMRHGAITSESQSDLDEERRQVMEKQQFEHLVALLKELNEDLESISVGLGEIVNSLGDIRDEIKELKSGH